MHAILLIFDESEEKTEEVSYENHGWLRKFLDFLPMRGSRDWYRFDVESEVKLCHCIRDNSLDRAKMLIRYLRKTLCFKKSQISFLRTSKFETALAAAEKLKIIIDEHESDNILFYYSGHGLSDYPGWSFGGNPNGAKFFYYELLEKIFKSFQGKLIFINDCCHALSVEPYLKDLEGRYLLFGASRAGSVSNVSILDSILGPWQHSLQAFPKVYLSRSNYEYTRDYPLYCVRGSYYSCNCGTVLSQEERFSPEEMPSLRRGSDLDFLFFPIKTR